MTHSLGSALCCVAMLNDALCCVVPCTLSSSALHDCSSMAFATLLGFVTNKSSPTIWTEPPIAACNTNRRHQPATRGFKKHSWACCSYPADGRALPLMAGGRICVQTCIVECEPQLQPRTALSATRTASPQRQVLSQEGFSGLCHSIQGFADSSWSKGSSIDTTGYDVTIRSYSSISSPAETCQREGRGGETAPP